MKKIVLFVLVIALCGVGITAAALIAKARTEAVPVTTKVNTPTNTEDNGTVEGDNSEPTTTEPVTTQEQEVPIPTVYGADLFVGTLVATQDDLYQAYVTNGQGDYRLLLYSDQFKPNTKYGFAWTINPRVLDIDGLSFLHGDENEPAIFYFIGDWNAAIENGTNFMRRLVAADFELPTILTNRWVFETGPDDTQILFVPFVVSGLSEAPSRSFLDNAFSNVLLSVFELPPNSVEI